MKTKTIIAPESKVKSIEVKEPDEIEMSSHAFDKLTAHRRALQKYDSKQQYTSPIEEIAQDKMFLSQVKFPGSEEAYPNITHVLYRFVSHMYPNAKKGPLWVDRPKNEPELFRAYDRHEKMKKLGLRHIVVERDSTLESLLEQLGEF